MFITFMKYVSSRGYAIDTRLNDDHESLNLLGWGITFYICEKKNMTMGHQQTHLLLLISILLVLLQIQSNNAFTTKPTLISIKHNHKIQLNRNNVIYSSSTTNSKRLLSSSQESNNISSLEDVGFILLAGGTGSRMKENMPKQFLTLRGITVLQHSLNLLLDTIPSYLNGKGPAKVILVIDPKYQSDYQDLVTKYNGRLVLANPGVERQGSVENGLDKLIESSDDKCAYVAVHDSARPLVTIQEILNVVSDARKHGAAVLGVPCKATIKESDDGTFVQRTIPRSRLWEVHTPQVIKIDTLKRGFEKVANENLEVTDDVSIIEALGEPVKLTLGGYTNIKITTPEDMEVADSILSAREENEEL